MTTLGKNIKALRTQRGMSQGELAREMDTTQQRVSEWETDRIEPSFYNIVKLLKVLDITFEDLTDGL